MECLNCKNPFTPIRSRAKFCSNNCRTLYHLNNKPPAAELPVKAPATNGLLGLSGNPSFDYIFNRTESENRELKSENRTLRDRLETEREKYRELKLQVDTKDRLDQADKTLEQSKGLGGLIDKVTGNDRLMDAIEKIAMAKLGMSEDNSGSEDLLEGVDDENKMLIQAVINMLQVKDENFLAHFVKVTQFYSANPELLIATSNKITKKVS